MQENKSLMLSPLAKLSEGSVSERPPQVFTRVTANERGSAILLGTGVASPSGRKVSASDSQPVVSQARSVRISAQAHTDLGARGRL